MKFLALMLGVGLLVWSVDLSTDVLLGGHATWMSVAGIGLGGIGWIVAADAFHRRDSAASALVDFEFDRQRREPGDLAGEQAHDTAVVRSDDAAHLARGG